VKGEEMAQLCYRGIDILLTSPHIPTLLQLRVAVSASKQYSASQRDHQTGQLGLLLKALNFKT